MKKREKKQQMCFKQALEYVLDLLCFAYYVKADSLVSDTTFDELEKLYQKMFDKPAAPMRGVENGMAYTYGIHVVYDYVKEKEQEEKIK